MSKFGENMFSYETRLTWLYRENKPEKNFYSQGLDTILCDPLPKIGKFAITCEPLLKMLQTRVREVVPYTHDEFALAIDVCLEYLNRDNTTNIWTYIDRTISLQRKLATLKEESEKRSIDNKEYLHKLMLMRITLNDENKKIISELERGMQVQECTLRHGPGGWGPATNDWYLGNYWPDMQRALAKR